MCACEPGFVCSRCADTPDDPRRDFDLEPERDRDRDRDDGYCDCGAHVAGLPCYFPPIIFAP